MNTYNTTSAPAPQGQASNEAPKTAASPPATEGSDTAALQGWHDDRQRKRNPPVRGFIPIFEPPRAPQLRSWLLIVVSVISIISFTMAFRTSDTHLQERASADEVVIQSRQAATLMSVESEDSILAQMRALATTPNATRRVATTWAALDRGDGMRTLIALSLMSRIPEQVAQGAPLLAPAELDPLLIRAFHYPLDLTEKERDFVRDEVGWPAELLLVRDLEEDAPARVALYSEASKNSAFASIVVVFALLAGAAGTILLASFVMRVRAREVLFELEPAGTSSDIYLEAFAIYLGCFAAGQAVTSLVGGRMAAVGVVAQLGGSLLGVFWPALRGVPLSVMGRDLGFHKGEGWLTELRAGVVGYMAMLPIFAFGVVVMLVLRKLLTTAGIEVSAPVHPDMVGLGSASFTYRLVMFGLAALFAPVFEETMFRGALWRGLRARWGFGLSAVVMAFIFAAIHPQGALAIPPLAALAIGFAGLREWRGSLIAPMLAHAIHNGTLVLLSSILLS